MHYKAGETVYDRGELIPGFFIVWKGRFKFSYQDGAYQSCEKVFELGDHGEDQAIQADRSAQGKLAALEANTALLKPDKLTLPN